MNIYDAIMKAADYIEQHPKAFEFYAINIPACGTPGCALGWIGAMAGFKNATIGIVAGHKNDANFPVESSFMKISQREFYKKMDSFNVDWHLSPDACAAALRAYAAKYHADDKQDDGDAFKRFLSAALRPERELTSAQHGKSA